MTTVEAARGVGGDRRASSPRRVPSASRRRDILDGLTFLGPFLLVYGLFLVVPVLQAVYMSGFDWDLLGFTRDYIGLDNYTRMLWGTDIVWSVGHLWLLRLLLLLITAGVAYSALRKGTARTAVALNAALGLGLVLVLGLHPSSTGTWNDQDFWISFKNTVIFTFVSTPILIAVGLALALALASKRRAGPFYRTFFFLPYVLPVSAVTLVWSYLLNPDRGLIAGALGQLGRTGIGFLSDPNLAMPAIIATTVWWSVGFNMVLFLAGLQDIDPSLYEAASLDGATSWQRFRHVTVPGLRHVTVLVAVTQLIASFQIFGQVYIMTKGGPGTATQVIIQHIYESGFKNFQLGYAATVSVFLFVIMSAVSAIQFRMIRQES